MSLSNVFVTGNNGFIGQKLLSDSRFINEFNCIHSNDRYTQFTQWAQYLYNADTVVHLASLAHSSQYTKDELNEINVQVPCDLYSACEENNVARFIYISTTSVYGEEPEISDFSVKSPESDLALSRLKAEERLLILSEKSKVELVILNLPLVYSLFAPANFGTLVKLVEKSPLLPFKGLETKKNMISIYNVIDLIYILVNYKGNFRKKQYLATEGGIIFSDLISEMTSVLNKNAIVFKFPSFRLLSCICLFSKRLRFLVDNQVCNSETLFLEFGWIPRFGLRNTFELDCNNKGDCIC